MADAVNGVCAAQLRDAPYRTYECDSVVGGRRQEGRIGIAVDCGQSIASADSALCEGHRRERDAGESRSGCLN